MTNDKCVSKNKNIFCSWQNRRPLLRKLKFFFHSKIFLLFFDRVLFHRFSFSGNGHEQQNSRTKTKKFINNFGKKKKNDYTGQGFVSSVFFSQRLVLLLFNVPIFAQFKVISAWKNTVNFRFISVRPRHPINCPTNFAFRCKKQKSKKAKTGNRTEYFDCVVAQKVMLTRAAQN